MSTHAAPPAPGSLRVAVAYVRPERGPLVLSAVLATVKIGCRLLGPWPLALAVDNALGGRPLAGPTRVLDGLGSTGLLVAAGIATVLLTVISGLVDTLSSAIAERAAERIGGAMRAAVFEHMLGLSLRWHDRMRTGEMVSRLTSDVGRLLDALVSLCTSLLPNALLLLGSLAVLVAVSPQLAGLGLLVLPVLAWLTARQRHRVRAAEMVAREASGQVSAAATDLLRNVRAVQAFGRLDRAAAMFARPNDRAVQARTAAMMTEARWSPVPDIVLEVGAGAILVAGGLQVRQGTLTVGELLVVLLYLGNLQSPVRSLVRLTSVRAKAAVSADRLRGVLDSEESVPVPRTPRPVPAVRHGLRLQSVQFSYSPERPVLAGFDLSVAAGETVCLFGPSGAGKSTVLHLLLRLYDVDAGRVLIDGVDVRDVDPVELRHQLAFVPQDPWLLDGTIAENIAFGSDKATRADVLAAGRAAWVDEFALSLPEGYDTPLGESGVRLSGGQRRRVALARAVVSTAPVVLLDEPTTSLDAESARQVVGAIRSATRDRTVLLVTHDPVLAAIADRTVPVSSAWRSVDRPGATSANVPIRSAGVSSPVPATGLPASGNAGTDRPLISAGRTAVRPAGGPAPERR